MPGFIEREVKVPYCLLKVRRRVRFTIKEGRWYSKNILFNCAHSNRDVTLQPEMVSYKTKAKGCVGCENFKGESEDDVN